MILKEDVSKRFSISEEIKAIDEQISLLTERKKSLESDLKVLNESLLKSVKEEKKDNDDYDVEFDGLFLTYFAKVNVGYTSEEDVINYLKKNNLSQFVKIKTTESIDKKALDKELKTNKELETALNKFIEKKVTDYVTVTDKENHDKMLEHVEENKKEEVK